MNDSVKKTVVGFSSCSTGRGPLKAVKLEKTSQGYEVIWKKSFDPQADPGSLAEVVSLDGGGDGDLDTATVMCFDSSAAGFYRIDIPPVDDSQVRSLVSMQAEALLPLPLDQMQFSYRCNRSVEGKKPTTIVAARRESLGPVADRAMAVRASAIFLSYEAVVKAFSVLCRDLDDTSVMVYPFCGSVALLLVEGGVLSHAVTIDVETCEQFDSPTNCELFLHDFRRTLELFGISACEDVDIFILSGEEGKYGQLVSYFSQSGIELKEITPGPELLGCRCILSSLEVVEHIESIGGAMLYLDDEDALDLFEGLYVRADQEMTDKSDVSLKRPLLAAIAMVVVFLLVGYLSDKAALGRLNKHLYSTDQGNNLTVLLEAQSLRKNVAAQRPDLLDLMVKLSESAEKGITINSFTFKKRKPVVLSGSATNNELLYKFQKSLNEQSSIFDVKISNSNMDEKKKKVSFKMTLHFGNFTRKK